MDDRGVDGYRGDLNRHCHAGGGIEIGRVPHVYVWEMARHQMINPKTDADKHNWPMQRGFDQFYGTIHGGGSFFDPNTVTQGNEYVSPFADASYTTKDMANGEFYYTDAIADHASRFIHDHHQATNEEPFFLYVAFTAAHWPMQP